jgi:hypothetical protein
VAVSDEGSGFNVREHKDVGVPTISSTRGGGLLLMWAFMDRVGFNKTGNQVVMVKKRAVAEPLAAESTDIPSAQPTTPSGEAVYGLLIARSTGSTIQLRKRRLIIGRDASCDISLKHTSISQHHCILFVHEGWWFVKDAGSRNGIRVNEHKVRQSRLNPGSVLTVGFESFEIDYSPYELGAEGLTPPVDPF